MDTQTELGSYEALKAMHDSEGMKYLGRLKVRTFTLHIFERNVEELAQACAVVEKPENGVKFLSEEHRGLGLGMHMETMRLFHNMLASAKSLIDHTRVFMEEHYKKAGLKQRYEERVKSDVAEDPLMRFVQDLRNYMLHRALPNTSMSVTFTKREDAEGHHVESTIALRSDRLLEWDGWTKPSKTFIHGAGETIKLSALADAYARKVLALHTWLTEQIAEHHKSDLDELGRLQERFRAAESKGRNPSAG